MCQENQRDGLWGAHPQGSPFAPSHSPPPASPALRKGIGAVLWGWGLEDKRGSGPCVDSSPSVQVHGPAPPLGSRGPRFPLHLSLMALQGCGGLSQPGAQASPQDTGPLQPGG